jgi:DNA-binding NtrC family response regulator
MSAEHPPADPTAPASRKEPSIRVFGERVFLAHPAPPAGSLTIGRADRCDIVVDEHSVSRVHARLHFGESVLIEDAGSSNGTRVGGVRLRAGQQHPLRPGEIAELGTALVIIDAAASGSGAPRGARGDPPHDAPDAGRSGPYPRPEVKGAIVLDDAMLALDRLIGRVAGSDISVLLTGETGAGKEVLADRIHARSPRRDGPFLRLNCAALAEPLLESELFGHEKGAFTGAARAKPGLFEATSGGTVFLDELGEMPLALQAKLLRVLDERKVWPVGSVQARPIDVRFVSATNRVLEDEIAAGRFRQDLYFRLSGVSLHIPPLRERPRELLALADAFLTRAATALGAPGLRLGVAARLALARHAWPGNVRELKNVIERAALLANGDEIGDGELGLARSVPRLVGGELAPGGAARSAPPAGAAVTAALPPTGNAALDAPSLHEQVDALERRRILDTLERCGGNQSEAARRLGVSRGTLIARLARYRVSRSSWPIAADPSS